MKVYLIRGNRISPKSGIHKWRWETDEHGRGAEFNSKHEARQNWVNFAEDNKITNYTFAQKINLEVIK